MAEELDPRQLEELAAFARALRTIGGYETDASWARESGYPATNLSLLLNGKSGISGFNLLRLIRAVAPRVQESDEWVAVVAALAAKDVVPRSIDDRLRSLEEKVVELPTAQDMKEALDAVLERLPPVASERTDEAASGKPRKRAVR